MVLNLEREIRRHLLSWILGDLNRFGELSTRPMCRGQLKHFGEHLGYHASHGFNEYSTYAQQQIRTKLMNGPEPLVLLGNLIAQNSIDPDNESRVRDEHWADWLEVCWGHDSDTLSMLASRSTIQSFDAFVAAMQALPIIQAPVGAIQRNAPLRDAHVHAGALCPPSLMWAHLMNTGVFVEYQDRKKGNKYSTTDSLKKELHLRGYLGVSRVLLAALIDLCESGQIPDDQTLLSDNRARLIDVVSSLVKGENTRDNLVQLLLQELTIGAESKLTKSHSRGLLYDLSVTEFLQKERTTVATFMWLTKEGQVATFIEELFLTYLRCKNHWFQVNSGLTTASQGRGLEYFRVDKELGQEGTNRGDLAIAAAINSMYRRQEAPKLVDVRLTRVERAHLPRTLNWLNTVFDSIDWNLVISLPRYRFDQLDNIQSLKSSMLDFVNAVFDNVDNRNRLAGIDVVGLERDTSWRPYLPIMRQLREHIDNRLGTEKSFIVFHCGEDTIIPLKGICDIWFVLKGCPLKRGDRVAHGLDLLYPTRDLLSGKLEMLFLQWEDLKDSMTSLLSAMGEDPRRSEAEELWIEIETSAVRSLDRVSFNAELTQRLALCVQGFVAETLSREEIIFETCPTSNWRIKGLFSPLNHPINWWINTIKGQYLVGTDDPALLPCTIDAECYAVARSMEFSG